MRMPTLSLAVAASAALVCLLALLPASAQQVVPADDASGQAAVRSFPVDADEEIDVLRGDVQASSLETDRHPVAFGRRVGIVATTVFNVLASQNRLRIGVPDDWMDGYLRPPSDETDATVLLKAKELYDEATTYRTDRFDMSIDPFSLEWRLTLRLSRYLGAGSD